MAFPRSPELLTSLRESARPTTDPIVAARSVFWIAFSVRKLSETGELSHALERRPWSVGLHPRRADAPVRREHFRTAYELGFARDERLSTLRLCGLLIGCYVFAATEEGIYFTGHFERDHALFHLDWAELAQIVKAVCDDRPARGVMYAA